MSTQPTSTPEATPKPFQNDLAGKANEMTKHLLAVLIDSTFLCIWALLNFGGQLLIAAYKLHGVERLIFYTIQLSFGIATLAPIANRSTSL